MNNTDIRDFCHSRQIELIYDRHETKVQAFNSRINNTAFDWQVCVAVQDDMIGIARDWDDLMAHDFDHDYAQAFWYGDGRNTSICTFSVFGRDVYETLMGKQLYDERFGSVYCDDWYTHLLLREKKLVRSDRKIVFHDWDRIRDELRRKTEEREVYERDRATFHRLIAEHSQPRA